MFKSLSYSELASTRPHDRSPLEALLAVVLAVAWIGFVFVLLLGAGPSRAPETDANFIPDGEAMPVAIEEASVGSPGDLDR
jgi:hypothetical protein